VVPHLTLAFRWFFHYQPHSIHDTAAHILSAEQHLNQNTQNKHRLSLELCLALTRLLGGDKVLAVTERSCGFNLISFNYSWCNKRECVPLLETIPPADTHPAAHMKTVMSVEMYISAYTFNKSFNLLWCTIYLYYGLIYSKRVM